MATSEAAKIIEEVRQQYTWASREQGMIKAIHRVNRQYMLEEKLERWCEKRIMETAGKIYIQQLSGEWIEVQHKGVARDMLSNMWEEYRVHQ